MNPRQLALPAALVGLGFVLSLMSSFLVGKEVVREAFIALGLAAGAAVLVGGGGTGKGPSLGPVVEALRLATRGKRPRIPENVAGELAETYDEIDKVAKRSAELTEEVARLEQNAGGGSPMDLAELLEAVEGARKG
jgi:hypothetical protein